MHAAASTSVDPRACPLCGKGNQCAMEMEKATGQKQPPCWCTGAAFGADLLARVPDYLRNQACICAACASAAKDSAQASD